jgi:membrane-associated phospholipid phosphatase
MAGRRTVLVAIAAVVVALVAAAVTTNVYAVGGGNPIDTHPAPPLFPHALVQPLGQELAAQRVPADRAFAQWSAGHPGRDDASFAAFAVSRLAAPARGAGRAGELAEVRRLATSRTKQGVDAATWLELYGKTDVWKLYRHDYAELRPAKDGDAAKAALKDARTLTKTITGLAQARFGSDAPFIADPALRPDKQVAPGTHKLSYPSKHAVDSYSALTLLTHLEPLRGVEYTDMAEQVAYSRLYMAGHYRSDLTAGAFLGDLIGDYVVRVDGL